MYIVMYYAKFLLIQNVQFHFGCDCVSINKNRLHRFHLLISKNASTKSLNETIHSLHKHKAFGSSCIHSRIYIHAFHASENNVMWYEFLFSMENFSAKLINLLRAFPQTAKC